MSPPDPAARSWGNGRRASGFPGHPRPALAVLATLALFAAACAAGPGASISPSPSIAAASPTVAASLSASPTASPLEGPIDTAQEAIEAVVAERPEFEGYPLEDGGGPIVIGASTSVVAQDVPEGIRLIFITGSGDCPAGCINKDYDVFLVSPQGEVTEVCHWRTESGEVAVGTPCVDLPLPRT